MRTSRRTCLSLPALLIAALAALPAAPVSARIIEIGKAATETPPSCPSNPCQAISKTTGYQAKVGATRAVFAAPADGKIVAWTITLGKPGPKQIKFFDDNYGGPAKAGISILKPGSKLFGRVTAESPLQSLQPWFGQTVQFPLGTSLNVKKGYIVALTVPSWAPALSLGMGNDTSWRASRARGGCNDTDSQTAQLQLASLARYVCLYRTARLTYSATLITTPQLPR